VGATQVEEAKGEEEMGSAEVEKARGVQVEAVVVGEAVAAGEGEDWTAEV
jgi:hypothetical protein